MSLSKLELRAKVIDIIDRLNIDISDIQHQMELTKELKNLGNLELVVHTLLKELNTDDENKIQKVSFLLLEMNSLEHSKDILWEYIKSSDSSDRLKEASCILLKSLGEHITAEDLLDYMDDPQKLIDSETQKLMETALSNPEAQVDLIDFMFAVSKEEQISLIKSLVYDYPGDSLANILSTVAESIDDESVKELCINILSETKSHNALGCLEDILTYSTNANLRKQASLALKKLKLLGISSEEGNYGNRGERMCEDSKPYKFFTTYPDGVGSQCVVCSRVDSNGLLSVVNTIVDDIDGVIDCFGFFCITEFDFNKILDRLNNQSVTIEITPEYAKKILSEAELLTKKLQYPIPYEYSCWKHTLYDIQTLEADIDGCVKKWADEIVFPDYKSIEQSNIFSSWFFEEADNEYSKNMIEDIFSALEKEESLSVVEIDNKIDEYFLKIFDEKQLGILLNRMNICAYLADIQEDIALRNSVSFVAEEIKNTEKDSLKDIRFLLNILRKTVLEAFLRELNKHKTNKNSPANIFTNYKKNTEKLIPEDKLNFMIDLMIEKWSSY